MKKLMANLALAGLLVSMTACLKTRSELRGSDSSSMRTDSNGRYVSGDMGQQQRAQIDSRFFEIDRDFRQLYGKIETIEKQMADAKAPAPATDEGTPQKNEKLEGLEKRIATIEEALLALDKKMNELKSEKKKEKKASSVPAGPFQKAEELFEEGEFEQAVAEYDKYRKKNPNGKNYAEATLKMGQCFQKLQMNQDAKAFYKEVIQRFPNTQVAQKAQSHLRNI